MAEHKSPSGQVQYVGTGRRKCAVARVFLRPGEGKITINGRTPEDYFPTPAHRLRITQPLQVTDATEKFDLLVLTNGGGLNGQADAIRMGLARALQDFEQVLLGGEHACLRRAHPKLTHARFEFADRVAHKREEEEVRVLRANAV